MADDFQHEPLRILLEHRIIAGMVLRKLLGGVFSCTFGLPPASAIEAIKGRGMFLIGTATTVEEAVALALGAAAVQMGTAFLTCDEAGVPEAYKQAILTWLDSAATAGCHPFPNWPSRIQSQEQLCEVATTVRGCPPGAVTLDNGACVVHSAPTQRLTFAEVAAVAAAGQRSLRAQKLCRVSQSPHMSPCTAQVVEVEVDPDTAQVTLLEVVTTHDVSTIIHPLGHQGQSEGGLMQDIGFGMLEAMRPDEGRVGPLSLGEYT